MPEDDTAPVLQSRVQTTSTPSPQPLTHIKYARMHTHTHTHTHSISGAMQRMVPLSYLCSSGVTEQRCVVYPYAPQIQPGLVLGGSCSASAIPGPVWNPNGVGWRWRASLAQVWPCLLLSIHLSHSPYVSLFP